MSLLQRLARSTPIYSNIRLFSTSQDGLNIGFIGLGNMGGFMSANLLKRGHNVTVYDINTESVEKLKQKGAKAAPNVKSVANGNSVFITMLPSNSHVTEVVRELSTVIAPGSLVIDCSTIDPTVSQMLNKEVTTIGSKMVDAPVSGGVTGAENGTLTFMVGGTEEALNAAKPVLLCMGKNVVHCGASGAGEAAKLCNNLALAISMIGTSEAMNLGQKLGMDPVVLASVMNTSTARCWSSDTYNPCPGVIPGVPSSRGYEGGFAADLMLKDLFLAQQAAKSANANLPMGSLAHQLYSLMSVHGGGRKDFSGIFQFLRGVKF